MADAPGTVALNQRALALRPSTPLAALRALAPVLLCVGLAVFLQLVLRPTLGDFHAKLLLDIGTNITLAVSLTIVNGFTGQFSIGHAAFMAVGAYAAAGLTYYGSYRLWGSPDADPGLLSGMAVNAAALAGRDLFTAGDLLFLGSLVVGGLVAAAAGYVVGLPSLRLRGDYLAIVTLGFGEIVRVFIQQSDETLYDPTQIAATPAWELPGYFGGALGFTGLPFYSSLFWSWLFAFITVLVAFRLKESSYGRAFLSIREDEVAAEAMGIHTTRYKVRAFVISAFFAGIAGGIFAHTVGVQLNPQELGFQKSFDILIMVVLGGLGSISGAAIAAAILTILPELLRDPPSVFHPGVLAVVGAAAVGLLLGARRKVRAVVILLAAAAAWEILRRAAIAQGVRLSEYRMVLYALALILMMILRPQGLFGVQEIWDYPRRWIRGRNARAAAGESGRAGEGVSL